MITFFIIIDYICFCIASFSNTIAIAITGNKRIAYANNSSE